MSHRVSEGARMALLIVCTLALAVLLCFALAGAVHLALAWPNVAPALVILLGLAALAAGYLGFRYLVARLLGHG
jgi:CHASE2 domain-containing sensor protein